MKRGKALWVVRLPSWRRNAVGVLAKDTVFVVVLLDHDRDRPMRLEIPVRHVEAFCRDVWNAYVKAINAGDAE